MRLIDADALKKAFKKSPFVNEVHLYYARQLINLAPTVKRPHGKWIPCKDYNFCKCSECQHIVMSEERSNYCPNCGVKLRKEGDDK